MSTTEAQALLSANKYRLLPDAGHPTELVRGKVVKMNVPGPLHGRVCATVARILGNFVNEHDLGHVMSNDSGILTQRNPDTVRGADVAFYSFQRMPKGEVPESYHTIAPELVIEVRLPDDRWSKLLGKVAEYLEAGVMTVMVLDPQTRTARLYEPDQPERVLQPDEPFTLPEILGDFQIPVSALFA